MSTEEGDKSAAEASETRPEGTSLAERPSVGARLAAARAVTGLSVAQVAQRLHSGPDLIEALEADRFADLGAPVFARGHLRRYSELLGLPIEEMLAQLADQENRDPPMPDLTQVPRAETTAIDLRALRPVIAGVAAVVAFALLIWLVLTQTPADTETSTTAAATASPSQNSPQAESKDKELAASETPVSPSMSVMSPSGASPTGTSSAGASPATASDDSAWPPRASVIAQRGGFSLGLSVTESCWVEIYDKDNNPLYYDMAQPGRRIQVSGAAPLRVRLGLADVVSLEFLGRRLSVPTELIRESLAHFTVAADGSFRRYVPPAVAQSAAEPRPSGT